MKYQKERCLQCDRLTRPTDFQSKYNGRLSYGELDSTGKFCETEYWFCSDTCYEEAFSKYLENEYLPKYWIDKGREYYAPEIRKALEKILGRYKEEYADCSEEYVKNVIGPRLRAEQIRHLKEWQYNRDRAVETARLELKERVESEYWDRFYKDHEKFLEEEDKQQAAVQREVERLIKEGERKEEQRRKEEEKRAAEKAEEEKWRPRPFKL